MKLKSNRFLCYAIIILCLVYSSCNKNTIDESPPQLSVVPVDFSILDNIIVFGQELSPGRKSPAIEYIVSDSQSLVSAISSGYVEKIILNEEFADCEIWVKPNPDSNWLIIYDHILEVAVLEDDTIMAGTVLGTVGIGNRTEIQINQGTGQNALSYCLLNFGTTAFIDEHLNYQETWCLDETVIP